MDGVTVVTPRIDDGQLGLAFVPLRSSAGRWDPPHPGAMGMKGSPTPCDAHDTQMLVAQPHWGHGGSGVPVAAPASPWGLWVLEGAGPGCCLQPREIPLETQPCPHKSSRQQPGSRCVRRLGAALVQRLGLMLRPGCWGRHRSLGKGVIKGRAHPLCLLGKKIPSGGDGGKPPRSPGDVGPSPPLPQTCSMSSVQSLGPSLYPTCTIINPSPLLEPWLLPPGSPWGVRGRRCCCLPLLAKGGVPAQPCPAPSRIQPGFQELGLGRVAVGDSWCLGWHPLALRHSGPDAPLS